MELVYLNNDTFNEFPKIRATIGAYDGIHNGHLKVLEELKNNNQFDYKLAVFTFDVHPDYVLNKRTNSGVINTIDEKINVFKDYNIDYIFILPKDILSKTYLEFNNYIKQLNVVEVVVGSDFRYGLNGLGDVDCLSKDFKVSIVQLKLFNNKKISSTTIREYLSNGNVKGVKQLLGSFYKVYGSVIRGKQMGATLGFKTANLDICNKYKDLKNGVYKVKVMVNCKSYLGICNYGFHPTINQLTKAILEIHILDFEDDIYGQYIEVYFIDFIRAEIKFENLNELKKQIIKDIEYLKRSED